MGLLDSARRQVGKNHQSKTRTDRLDPRRRVSREPAGPNARQSVRDRTRQGSVGLNQSRAPEPTDPRVQAALREYRARSRHGETIDRETFLAEHASIANAQALACREREVRPCQFSRETDRRVDRFVDGPGTGNAGTAVGRARCFSVARHGSVWPIRPLPDPPNARPRCHGDGLPGGRHAAQATNCRLRRPTSGTTRTRRAWSASTARRAWRPCFETSISAPSLTSGRSTGRTTLRWRLSRGVPSRPLFSRISRSPSGKS